MQVLIIAAHGSRNKTAAREVAALAQRIREKSHRFDRIYHAFLQFADPLLPEVLEAAAAERASRVVVFPLFMATGSHVLTDIPEQVGAAAKAYPDIDFSITRHLGVIGAVEDLILDEVQGAGAEG